MWDILKKMWKFLNTKMLKSQNCQSLLEELLRDKDIVQFARFNILTISDILHLLNIPINCQGILLTFQQLSQPKKRFPFKFLSSILILQRNLNALLCVKGSFSLVVARNVLTYQCYFQLINRSFPQPFPMKDLPFPMKDLLLKVNNYLLKFTLPLYFMITPIFLEPNLM